jgi:hypothetical protein
MKLDTVVDGNRGWMESGHWQSQKDVSRRFGSNRGVVAGARNTRFLRLVESSIPRLAA